MRCFYITFRSVTYAQRAEQVLERAGIRCSIQRTPRWMEERGCGYCIRLWAADPSQAAELLREKKVAYRKVYWQQENGALEELVL